MSIQAVAWAIDQKTGSPAGKVVLICLANYSDEKGECWPSQTLIAEETELSERSVREWLQRLEDADLIVRERRNRADGSRKSDLITLKIQTAKSAGRKEANRQLAPSQPAAGSGLTTFEPSLEPSAAAAREKLDLDGLTSKLVEAAGDKIQPHGAIVLSAILGLIESGVDLETDILPTIRVVSSRLKRPAGSWAYFVAPIREAFEARTAAGKGLIAGGRPTSQPAGSMMLVGNEWKPTTDARWGSRLNSARAQGQWSTVEWGPAPGQPGSIVPKHLLQPGDGEGWREWQSEAA